MGIKIQIFVLVSFRDTKQQWFVKKKVFLTSRRYY